ncbi:MAG: NapC/NirT family cytochrome c [Bacteroidetes bacterium]|nr:NapC/NirT family cytochrome c [Bacteroidota bacterium]
MRSLIRVKPKDLNAPINEVRSRLFGKSKLSVALRSVLLGAGITLAIVLVITVGAVTVSSNPSFCSNCHQIRPLVDEWQASTHKEANCISCHTPPGPAGYVKILTTGSQNILLQLQGEDTLPQDITLSDASCVSCHNKDLRPEQLPQATLKIAHSKHTDESCTDCHSRLVHPRQFQPAIQAQLGTHANKDCQVCHPSPAPTYLHGQANIECNSCHSATIPNHDLARKQGSMLREDCLQCHNRLRVADPSACEVCHVSPHGIDQNCQACHASTQGWTDRVFNHPLALTPPHNTLKCNQCHSGATFQSGTFNCISCHQPKHESMGDNCVTCHKPGAWKPVQVDHTKIWSGYTGKHATLACAACHSTGKYRGTSGDCKSCHKPPEKHFGDNCASCHRPDTAFKPRQS